MSDGVRAGSWSRDLRRAAVLCAALAAVCAGPASARQAQHTVRGVVVERGTPDPVTGASVRLEGGATVETDGDGLFELRNVPAGSQRIVVTALGYRAEAIALIVRADTTLRVGLRVQPVDLAPLDVETRRVTIRGRVTDAATERALHDADVLAGDEREATDVDGRYDVGGVPSHRMVVLEVRALGYMPQAVALDLTADTTIDFALAADPIGRRMIEARMAAIDDRSLHSPYGRRLIGREELLLRSNWSARDLVRDRLPLRRGIACLVVDEREIRVDPLEYLGTYTGVELHHVEILTYGRSVTVRVYSRRFMERMVSGAVRLRGLVPGFCG